MPWTWLLAIGVLGYLQRSLPWGLAARYPVPHKVADWLRYVAPAAFATLMIEDLPHLTGAGVVALATAALVSWRTSNLGLAVMASLGMAILFQSMGLH